MPPMAITCHLPEDSEEKEISVKAWEEVARSVTRELEALAVAMVSFDAEPAVAVRLGGFGLHASSRHHRLHASNASSRSQLEALEADR